MIFQNFNLAIFRSSPPLRQDIGPVLPWPIPSPRYKVRAGGGLWICGRALFGNGDHIREERRCRQPLEPLCEVNTGDLSNMHHHHFKHLIFIIIINNNNTSFSSSSSLLSLQRQGRYHLHRQQHFKNKGICILDAETFYNLYNKTSYKATYVQNRNLTTICTLQWLSQWSIWVRLVRQNLSFTESSGEREENNKTTKMAD